MSIAPTLPVIDDTVKLRFAAEMLRLNNASSAAMAVISDPGTALRQAYILPTDPIVIAEMERLKEEKGEASFLPTKYEIAREILERAKLCQDAESYEKLMKLYCSIMGFVEKPGNNVNVDVKVAPVMIVRDHGSDEEWEARAAEQQRELTLNAAN